MVRITDSPNQARKGLSFLLAGMMMLAATTIVVVELANQDESQDSLLEVIPLVSEDGQALYGYPNVVEHYSWNGLGEASLNEQLANSVPLEPEQYSWGQLGENSLKKELSKFDE